MHTPGNQTKQSGYLIIIPAFNAERSLPELLERLQSVCNMPILIVDDGSQIPLNSLKLPGEFTLITNTQNLGKGAALLRAFQNAGEQGFTHAITLDADLQHHPGDLHHFLDVPPEVDLVYGARNFTGCMPLHRRLSNQVTSGIVSLRTGVAIRDSQCGYRRYRLDTLSDLVFTEKGFQFETEVLLKILLRKKATVRAVPVQTLYDAESSAIRNTHDTLRFILLIIRSFFWKRK